MSEDLISNDLSKNIDLAKIKVNISLIKIILIIGSFTYILVILRWIKLLQNAFLNKEVWNKFRVLYAVSCSSRVILFIIFILSWFYYIKANKLIRISFIQNNADMFNQAYNLFNITSTLTIAGMVVSLIEVIASYLV